jgi:hypothetical protein
MPSTLEVDDWEWSAPAASSRNAINVQADRRFPTLAKEFAKKGFKTASRFNSGWMCAALVWKKGFRVRLR